MKRFQFVPSRTSAVGCEKTGRQEADIANKRDVAGAIYIVKHSLRARSCDCDYSGVRRDGKHGLLEPLSIRLSMNVCRRRASFESSAYNT